MEKIVVVKDVIGTPEAILMSFGKEVAEVVIKHLKKGHHVKVDFNGTKNVNINFTQGLVGSIYREFKAKQDRERVNFINPPNDFAQEEIDEAINLAKNRKKRERIARIAHKTFMVMCGEEIDDTHVPMR